MLHLFGDVAVSEVADRAGDLQALPLGHLELGTHFDVELECHRARFGNLDRFQVDLRFANRREVLVFANLLQAVHQQAAFDLIGNFLLESTLDDLPRCAADTEPRHAGRGYQVAEGVVKVAVDVSSRHRDRYVAFAGARRGDIDHQVERGRLLSGFRVRHDNGGFFV